MEQTWGKLLFICSANTNNDLCQCCWLSWEALLRASQGLNSLSCLCCGLRMPWKNSLHRRERAAVKRQSVAAQWKWLDSCVCVERGEEWWKSMFLYRRFCFCCTDKFVSVSESHMNTKPSLQLVCLSTKNVITLQTALNHNITSCSTANETLWVIWMIEQHNMFEIISFFIWLLMHSAMNGIWLKQQLLSL